MTHLGHLFRSKYHGRPRQVHTSRWHHCCHQYQVFMFCHNKVARYRSLTTVTNCSWHLAIYRHAESLVETGTVTQSQAATRHRQVLSPQPVAHMTADDRRYSERSKSNVRNALIARRLHNIFNMNDFAVILRAFALVQCELQVDTNRN